MKIPTKTDAMSVAQRAHSRPRGQGDSWFFMAPIELNDPDGPQLEVRTTSYKLAVAERSRRIAMTALVIMGWPARDAKRAIYDDTKAPTASLDRVNRALHRLEQSDAAD